MSASAVLVDGPKKKNSYCGVLYNVFLLRKFIPSALFGTSTVTVDGLARN